MLGAGWLIACPALGSAGGDLAHFPDNGQMGRLRCQRARSRRRCRPALAALPIARPASGRCRDATLPSVGRPTGNGRGAAPLPWRRPSSGPPASDGQGTPRPAACARSGSRTDREHDGAAMLRAWQRVTFAASAGGAGGAASPRAVPDPAAGPEPGAGGAGGRRAAADGQHLAAAPSCAGPGRGARRSAGVAAAWQGALDGRGGRQDPRLAPRPALRTPAGASPCGPARRCAT